MNAPKQSQRIVAEAERRRHPRYSVQVPIEIRIESSPAPLQLITTDLSRNGCYVVIDDPLWVGLRVQATLALAERRIVAHGRVVTRHPDLGNGIMFLEFERNGEMLLRNFLDRISAD